MGGTMGDEPEHSAPARYRAFISYSHADARFAAWLHRKLEAWSLPGQARLTPIFIDRAELAAGPDLSAQVREALGDSAALIVVASPAARTSRWVAQEISLYRELHPDRPVLAALVDGEPAQAFPDPLLVHRDQALEPLAADFREGHDGKRLALLKIVAGLTAQPLDRLVQRDAQSRQRRVLAITAGAVLLSVILAAALIVALRARTEAEHQRAEAEGMVEFMLTDLRDKLKGVGRLDIMDAVNERAMAHYAREGDLTGLPDDMLKRRALLLQAMGEDDLKKPAYAERARRELREAWHVTQDLLERSPDAPDRIMAHAQSEYWQGYVAFLDLNKSPKPNKTIPRSHWTAYLDLARRLALSSPSKRKWNLEVAYAQTNLCALALTKPIDRLEARRFCADAEITLDKLARASPGDVETQLSLSQILAWRSDSALLDGSPEMALRLRQRQLDLVRDLAISRPGDARVIEAVFLAKFGLCKLLITVGQYDQAARVARSAQSLVNAMARRDPNNQDWKGWGKQLAALQIPGK